MSDMTFYSALAGAPLSRRLRERVKGWGRDNGIYLVDADIEKEAAELVAREVEVLEATVTALKREIMEMDPYGCVPGCDCESCSESRKRVEDRIAELLKEGDEE